MSETVKTETSKTEVSKKPLDAETLRGEVTHYTCLNKCFGHVNNAAGCCKISDRDFIIGPIRDAKEFLQRLNKVSKTKYKYNDVFIEHKEGSKLFPDKEAWQNPEHYPALRLDMNEADLPCRFLTDGQECGVYEIRPQTCRKYLCEHLKKVLELL
jgi:Fe-S-cluster containining protein